MIARAESAATRRLLFLIAGHVLEQLTSAVLMDSAWMIVQVASAECPLMLDIAVVHVLVTHPIARKTLRASMIVQEEFVGNLQ